MDDLFSVRYDRIMAANRDYPSVSRDALGNFSTKLPSGLMRLYQRFGWLRTSLLKTEMHLVSTSENKCPARFDKCLLISKYESKVLRSRTGAQNVCDIPPRIEHSTAPPRRTWNGSRHFVFLGTLNLSHNSFGIEHFISNQLEFTLTLIPDMRLFIVGHGASENLRRLAGLYPGHVELTGFVENVDAVLSQSCAMLSPLLFGSGIKIKVIDALRCGVPLISTAAGVEGIDVEGVAGIRVVKRLDEFSCAMLDLLDPKANAIASNANLEAFQRTYSRPVVDVTYRNAFLGNS
jgi:glycosyltransferase involved in cell wall biosynthesis